jgi:hypothetical protein
MTKKIVSFFPPKLGTFMHACIRLEFLEANTHGHQLVALRIFFESGSTAEKEMARKSLYEYAFLDNNLDATPATEEEVSVDDGASRVSDASTDSLLNSVM